MKYILVNPEALFNDIERNTVYQSVGFMGRIKFGRVEPECEFAGKLYTLTKDAVKGQVDLTSVFEYQNYGVTQENFLNQLPNLFDIVEESNDEHNGEVIYIKYMSKREIDERSQEEQQVFSEKWNKLKERLGTLAPKQYSQKEKAQIVRKVLDMYTHELQQRGDIIFEQKSWEGLENERKIFNLKNRKYYVDNRKFVVETCIDGYYNPDVSHDDRMTNRGTKSVNISRQSMNIQISGECPNGQYEEFAKLEKEESKYGVANVNISCKIGDLYYNVETKGDTHHTQYFIVEDNSLEEISKGKFQVFSQDMVQPGDIDNLYHLLMRKIVIRDSDKLGGFNGLCDMELYEKNEPKMMHTDSCRKPTNEAFEEATGYKQIADCLARAYVSIRDLFARFGHERDAK